MLSQRRRDFAVSPERPTREPSAPAARTPICPEHALGSTAPLRLARYTNLLPQITPRPPNVTTRDDSLINSSRVQLSSHSSARVAKTPRCLLFISLYPWNHCETVKRQRRLDAKIKSLCDCGSFGRRASRCSGNMPRTGCRLQDFS